MILVTGGSGSGKSLFAENLSMKLKREPFYYIATMKIWDEECRKRIKNHRIQRNGKGFETLEIPCNLSDAVKTIFGGTALLECIGNLTANEQFDNNCEDVVTLIVNGILELNSCLESLIIVTNDVFSDIPPKDTETRKYLENIGKINCILAEKSDIVAEVCAGNPIIWKGKEKFDEIVA